MDSDHTEVKNSFNTQPPEGGCTTSKPIRRLEHQVSTHSRPKAAAAAQDTQKTAQTGFQHTAARRRLHKFDDNKKSSDNVSTHSRPKAAACTK